MIRFVDPGRNNPCHCGSGEKYKRCHEAIDQEAWRIVSLKTRQAEAVCATLPRSSRPEFNPVVVVGSERRP